MSSLYFVLFVCILYLFINFKPNKKFNINTITLNTKPSKSQERLTFNSTQTLGEYYFHQLEKIDMTILNQCTKIQCESNSNQETLVEINNLIELKSQRDIVTIQEINIENDPNFLNTVIAGLNMSQEEKEFVYRIYTEIVNPTTVGLKLYFNRVRPSFCNPDIEPIIEIPNHPSYPSGHAIQHYFMAYYLYYRHNNKDYFEKANIIAKNREIAGVHFESDSKYGKLIAFDLIKIILKLIDEEVLYFKSNN